MNETAKRDVQRIAVLLTCAVATAGLIAGVMLYGYSPSGRYIAGQTILDPQVMNQINIQDKKSKKEQNGRFVFEKIDFTYYDSASKKMEHIPVSMESYKKFYSLINQEKSIEKVTDELKNLFNHPHINRVVTTMHEGENTASKVFQMIEITPDDFFRVQLHGDQQNPDQWAYFYRNHINEEVLRIFTKSEK
jgi:hypothetical protein